MELSSANIENFGYFLKRKLFLYFRKWKPQKNSLYFLKRNMFFIFIYSLYFRKTETMNKFFIFQETEFSYIWGNGNPKKLLILQEITFRARKIKKPTLRKFLIFWEMDF